MAAGGEDDSPVVYRRRWYILMIFSFHAMFQCTVWNTWVESLIIRIIQTNIDDCLIFRDPWSPWH